MKSPPHNQITHLMLIGRKIKVIESSDPSMVGLTGTVVTESRNMFTIRRKMQYLKIPKKTVKIQMHGDGEGRLLVEGAKLVGKPEERIKKYFGGSKS